MKLHTCVAVACLLAPSLVWGQQANVNLDYNPQKNTENLLPFTANISSPEVRDADRDLTTAREALRGSTVKVASVARSRRA